MRRRPKPVAGSGATWAVGQGTLDGSAVIVRYDVSAGTTDERAIRPYRIGIAVPWRHRRGRVDDRAMNAVEDGAVTLAGERARLVLVLTTPASREFVFYADEASWAPEVHDALQRRFSRDDVQLHAEHDPDWTMYRSFLP